MGVKKTTERKTTDGKLTPPRNEKLLAMFRRMPRKTVANIVALDGKVIGSVAVVRPSGTRTEPEDCRRCQSWLKISIVSGNEHIQPVDIRCDVGQKLWFGTGSRPDS